MGKIFEFDPRKGSYIQPASDNIITNANGVLERSEKGLAWRGNGSNTAITFASDIVLSKDSSSIEAWFKANTNTGFIIANGTVSTYQYLGFRASDALVLDSDTNNEYWCLSTNIFPSLSGIWQHLVIVADGDGKSYLNGELVSTISPLIDDVTFNRIGKGSAYNFNGDLGRIQLYDHALSSEERAKLYQEFLRATPISKTIR
jgi:hypothetical protein